MACSGVQCAGQVLALSRQGAMAVHGGAPSRSARGCVMINTIERQIGAGNGSTGPSRRWYLVAGCLLAVAAACLAVAVIGIVSWDRQIQGFQRVPVPGRGEVTFTQPGDYVLYVETRGTCCSWAFGGEAGTFTVGAQGRPLASWSMRLAMGPVDGPRPIP